MLSTIYSINCWLNFTTVFSCFILLNCSFRFSALIDIVSMSHIKIHHMSCINGQLTNLSRISNLFVCQTCFAGSRGNARLSKMRRIVRRLKFTCFDPQDVPYNPAEQGQVGQLSNRYIVISRLSRYERLFISRSGCVTISCKIVVEHIRHSRNILLPRTRKSLRGTCAVSPARIALYEARFSNQTTEMQHVIMPSLPEIPQRIARNRK